MRSRLMPILVAASAGRVEHRHPYRAIGTALQVTAGTEPSPKHHRNPGRHAVRTATGTTLAADVPDKENA
jgi:hypothetical protein